MEPNEPHFNLLFLLIITVSCLAKGVSMETPETPLNPPLFNFKSRIHLYSLRLVSVRKCLNEDNS